MYTGIHGSMRILTFFFRLITIDNIILVNFPEIQKIEKFLIKIEIWQFLLYYAMDDSFFEQGW